MFDIDFIIQSFQLFLRPSCWLQFSNGPHTQSGDICGDMLTLICRTNPNLQHCSTATILNFTMSLYQHDLSLNWFYLCRRIMFLYLEILAWLQCQCEWLQQCLDSAVHCSTLSLSQNNIFIVSWLRERLQPRCTSPTFFLPSLQSSPCCH